MPIIGQPAHTHFTPVVTPVILSRISLSVTYLYNIVEPTYRVSLASTYLYEIKVIVSRSQIYLYNLNPVVPVGPTRLYFHAVLNPLPNLPTTDRSVLTPNKSVDAQTVNRTMSTTIGTAQTSLVLSSTATTTLQRYYFTKFVTDTLTGGISSITAQTWTYNFASKNSSPFSQFPASATNRPVRVVAYVWRPSTQSKVGDIVDGNSSSTVDTGSSSETANIATFSGIQVLGVQDGDVLVFEVWFEITQFQAAAYTDTFYYDGTTVTTVKNATVSSHASFIQTPQGLAFGIALTRVSKPSVQRYDIVGQISLSSVYPYNITNLVSGPSFSQTYTYQIATTASLSNTYLYDLTGRISFPSLSKYNILVRKSAAKIFRYSLQQTTLFSQIYRYNIANKIAMPLSTVYKYNIVNRVPLPQVYKYSITTRAALSRIYRYSITGRAALSKIIKYNITTAVSLSRIYRYVLGLGTSHTTTYKYNLLNRLSPSLVQRYKYGILARLTLPQSRTYKYNILTRLLSALIRIYRYNLLIQKQKPSILKYNLLGRVSLVQRYKYRIGDGDVSLVQSYLYHLKGRVSFVQRYLYKIIALAPPAIWKLTGQTTDFPAKLEDLVKDYLISKWSISDPSLGPTPIITSTSSPKHQAQVDNFEYDTFRTYYLKLKEVRSNVTTRQIRYNTYEFETPIEIECYSRRLKKGEAFSELTNIINELMRIFGTYQKEEIFGVQGITLEGITPIERTTPTPGAAQTLWVRQLRIILHYYKQSLVG